LKNFRIFRANFYRRKFRGNFLLQTFIKVKDVKLVLAKFRIVFAFFRLIHFREQSLQSTNKNFRIFSRKVSFAGHPIGDVHCKLRFV